MTYISILGGIGYIGYGVYQDRHPDPQIEADPTKKTLVILGMSPGLAGSQLKLRD